MHPYVSSVGLVVLGDDEDSLLLAKSAQPSSTFGLVGQKGVSKGVSVSAASGLESQGFPVSMAVASDVDPASMTSR